MANIQMEPGALLRTALSRRPARLVPCEGLASGHTRFVAEADAIRESRIASHMAMKAATV